MASRRVLPGCAVLGRRHPLSGLRLLIVGGALVARQRAQPTLVQVSTSEYKLAPIRRKIRELLGAAPPNFRRVPRGRTAEEWVGFSTDEIGRVAEPRVFYLRARAISA
jgi:hypothetical protein